VHWGSYFLYHCVLCSKWMNDLKKQLFQQCLEIIERRITDAMQSVQSARQAAADDTKSSAGDKYETTRAMMQQEIDRNLKQVDEASRLKVALLRLENHTTAAAITPGSIVITNNGRFYLSVSVGIINLDEKDYVAISPASPLGGKLIGLTAGDTFMLNGKSYLIEQVI
jgi:transcription elongation GreA/GreB family factor